MIGLDTPIDLPGDVKSILIGHGLQAVKDEFELVTV